MGQPSIYHATVALSFQIEICNLDRTKSSFLATSLYKKVIKKKLSYKVLSSQRRKIFHRALCRWVWLDSLVKKKPHTHTHTHARTRTVAHTNIHVHRYMIYTYRHTYIHRPTYIITYIHTYIHTHTHTHTHTYIHNIHTYKHTDSFTNRLDTHIVYDGH